MRGRPSPLFSLSVLLVVLAPSACDQDSVTVPPPVDIHGGPASVQVLLDPFQIRILDTNGAEVLRTLTRGDV